jgi:hypothetical protein
MEKRITYPAVGLTPTDVVPAVQKDAFKFLVDNLYKSAFSAIRGTNNINFYYQYTIDRYMVFHYSFVYLLSQYDSNGDFTVIHSQISSLLGYLVRDFDIITDQKNNFQLENVLFTTFVFIKTLITFLNKTRFKLAGNLENISKSRINPRSSYKFINYLLLQVSFLSCYHYLSIQRILKLTN